MCKSDKACIPVPPNWKAKDRVPCPSNADHQTAPSVRCLGTADNGAVCNASTATSIEQPTRVTEPTEGTCSVCWRQGLVQRQCETFPITSKAYVVPPYHRSGSLKTDVSRADEINMKRAAQAEAERLYCPPCLDLLLRSRKVLCKTCCRASMLCKTISTAVPGYFCAVCQSASCVETVVDRLQCIETPQCNTDGSHSHFVRCLTCTECGTCSAIHPEALFVLHATQGPCVSHTPQCKLQTRVYRSGCDLNHVLCEGCCLKMVRTPLEDAPALLSSGARSASSASLPPAQSAPTPNATKRTRYAANCIGCKKEVPWGTCGPTLKPEEEKHSVANAFVRPLIDRLAGELAFNIAARCSCQAAQRHPPVADALNPPARPLVACRHCGASFCAVCTKTGGCAHSGAAYSLPDVLKGFMAQWHIARVPHVLALLRAFVIVEQFYKKLTMAQKHSVLQSACPVAAVLHRFTRVAGTECFSAFKLGKGWYALQDEDNVERIKKLLGELDLDSNDLKFAPVVLPPAASGDPQLLRAPVSAADGGNVSAWASAPPVSGGEPRKSVPGTPTTIDGPVARHPSTQSCPPSMELTGRNSVGLLLSNGVSRSGIPTEQTRPGDEAAN